MDDRLVNRDFIISSITDLGYTEEEVGAVVDMVVVHNVFTETMVQSPNGVGVDQILDSVAPKEPLIAFGYGLAQKMNMDAKTLLYGMCLGYVSHQYRAARETEEK